MLEQISHQCTAAVYFMSEVKSLSPACSELWYFELEEQLTRRNLKQNSDSASLAESLQQQNKVQLVEMLP